MPLATPNYKLPNHCRPAKYKGRPASEKWPVRLVIRADVKKIGLDGVKRKTPYAPVGQSNELKSRIITGFDLSLELVFLSRESQFLAILPKP